MAGSHSLRGNFTLGKEDNGADPPLYQQSSFDWCFMVGKEGNNGQDHWETVAGRCRKTLGEKKSHRLLSLSGRGRSNPICSSCALFVSFRGPHNWHFRCLHLPILAWPGREILAWRVRPTRPAGNSYHVTGGSLSSLGRDTFSLIAFCTCYLNARSMQ